MHIGVDVETKEVLAIKITDKHSRDSRCLKRIIKESARHGTIVRVLGDGTFDSTKIFSCVDRMGAVPAIRVRRNSVPKSRGCYPKKKAVMKQVVDYKRWAASVSYAKRWLVESVFSGIKRRFGEGVRSKKRCNMVQELMLKISLCNRFMAEKRNIYWMAWNCSDLVDKACR